MPADPLITHLQTFCTYRPQGRVAVIQSLSGTGSLRVGSAFIARFLKGATVYLSNPTWGNHRNIFGDEGVEWKYYRWGGRNKEGEGVYAVSVRPRGHGQGAIGRPRKTCWSQDKGPVVLLKRRWALQAALDSRTSSAACV